MVVPLAALYTPLKERPGQFPPLSSTKKYSPILDFFVNFFNNTVRLFFWTVFWLWTAKQIPGNLSFRTLDLSFFSSDLSFVD